MTSRLLVDKIEGKTTANTVQMPSGSVVQTVIHDFQDETINTSNSDADFSGSCHTSAYFNPLTVSQHVTLNNFMLEN